MRLATRILLLLPILLSTVAVDSVPVAAQTAPTDDYSTTVLADGAVGYWTLDQAGGTAYTDYSGHSRTLSVSSGSQTLGAPFTGWYENNLSQCNNGPSGTVPFFDAPNVSAAWTVEVWMNWGTGCNPTASNFGGTPFADYGTASGLTGLTGNIWSIYAFTDTCSGHWGAVQQGIQIQCSSFNSGLANSANDRGDGLWHLVDVTYNGSATLNVYVDGRSLGTFTASSQSGVGNRLKLNAGGSNLFDSRPAVYDKVLSSSAIYNHYGLGLGIGTPLGPTAYTLNVTGTVCTAALVFDISNSDCSSLGKQPAKNVTIEAFVGSTVEATSITDQYGRFGMQFAIGQGSTVDWHIAAYGPNLPNGYGTYRPNGYSITPTQNTNYSGDFVYDADLARGTRAWSSMGAATVGFVYAASPALTSLLAGETAFATAEGVATAAVNGVVAPALTIGGFATAIPLSAALVALFWNPTDLDPAELTVTDPVTSTTTSYSIPAASTQTISIPATATVRLTTGTVEVVDTIPQTGANPDGAPVSQSQTGTAATPAESPVAATTGQQIFQCGSNPLEAIFNLGSCLQALFEPTVTVTDLLTQTQTELQSKAGFSDIYYLVGTADSPGWLNDPTGGWPSWISGSCWTFSMPIILLGGSSFGWTICASDSMPTTIRPFTTVGLLLFLAISIIGAVKAFLGWTGNVDSGSDR